MPWNLGGMEWVILAIVALLVFGGSRLASAGKNAGKAIREFKEETAAIKAGVNPAETTPEPDGLVHDAEIVEPDKKPGQQA
ncbi:MAG: twin-arginine translocase TatA/TatE family subunit [Micropruina sp.]|nr:twin-arginine translocase TatA/TatE family subunit [Micropruina sp.]